MHLRTLGLAAAGFALCSPQREQHPRIWCCLSLPVPMLRDVTRLFQHPELQQEEKATRKKIHAQGFFFLLFVGFLKVFLLLKIHTQSCTFKQQESPELSAPARLEAGQSWASVCSLSLGMSLPSSVPGRCGLSPELFSSQLQQVAPSLWGSPGAALALPLCLGL